MTEANVLLYSSIIIGVLLLIALLKKEQSEGLKLFLFWGMAIPTLFATLYLAVYTVVENQTSVTGGPVHWHADFQVFACGQPITLEEPKGLSNRIGTPLLHEHGDQRIHVEGTVQELQHVNLSNFFEKIGGRLTETFLLVPTEQGDFVMQNGRDCPNFQEKSELQVFLYKVDEEQKTFSQQKLDDFPGYVLSPFSLVPPGDCLIIEFGPSKDRTDHLCNFYKLAVENGEYTYVR